MAERAHVTSVEAIEAFRAHLVVYITRTRALLEEISSDLRRTRLWIDTDRRLYWEREVNRRAQKLQEAQQALFSARLSTFRDATATDQTLVQRARAELREGEDKLRRVRKWRREFGPATEPLARHMDGLETFLAQGGGRAVAYLSEVVRLLEEYSGTRRPAPAQSEPTTDAPKKESNASSASESRPAPTQTPPDRA